MDQMVTLGQLLEREKELKEWMIFHFVTKDEFKEVRQDVSLLKNGLSTLSDRVASGFDTLYGRLETVEQEQVFTNHALKRLEEDVDELKQSNKLIQLIPHILQTMGELKQTVLTIQEKLEE